MSRIHQSVIAASSRPRSRLCAPIPGRADKDHVELRVDGLDRRWSGRRYSASTASSANPSVASPAEMGAGRGDLDSGTASTATTTTASRMSETTMRAHAALP